MSNHLGRNHARASPIGDARRPRLNDVRNGKRLPTHKCLRLRLGTLNIGTMTGRSRELADTLKKRRIDIACVQETKWQGAKARDIGEGYKLFYNGELKTRNGVGVVVSDKLRDSVVEICRISDRLMSVKIDSGATTLRVVSCYAPQTGCPDNIKDQFWNSLDSHLRSFAPEEHVAIGGDLNGHVGTERGGYMQSHGGNGYGSRNDDGCRILDCAEAHDLAVANTFFKKKPAHIITYNSGGRSSQIDYWLIRRRDLKLATNVKVIPSDNIAPQHRLLTLDVRLEIGQRRPVQTTSSARIKWWHLPERTTQLTEELRTFEVNLDQSAAAIWDDVVNQIHIAGVNTLGKTKPGRRFIDKQIWWWNDAVQQAIREKKVAFKTWRNSRTDADHQQYKSLKSAAKRAVAEAKATHYNQLYDELDTPEATNKIYRLARARHRSTQDIGQVKYIKNDDHQVLRDPPAILQRWRDYFFRICNEEFSHPPIPNAESIAGPVPQITVNEVEEAVGRMKNGKVTGPDDIPTEVWKILGRQGASILASLFNQIVKDGEVPAVWKTSTTVPIWKGKGDVAECSNYRPIRLLCHTMKIFERVIDARLRRIVDITPNQCGFIKGCGTTDAIHAARLLLERYREKNKPVHMAFLDLEKAFDRVPHDLIWYSLRMHGIPETYVQWIQLLYRDVTSAVRCPAGTSPLFTINVGVHQGSTLSPLLFVLCMDTATADLQSPHPWSLLYADDVFLAAESRPLLQDHTQRWSDRLGEYGLRLNIKKTEYLECGTKTDGTIHIDAETLNKVGQFKYLGSIIREDGDTLPDARSRINAAWMKWREVTGVLCDRRMPVRLKSKIYKSVVRPVALYGSECWPATTKHERALHAMEMRMLRWCLGLTRLDHVMNVDVRKRMGIAPITEKMREARLRWYGHVIRRNEESVVKTALSLSPEGRRPRGRPKKRWLDRLYDDMRHVNAAPEDAFDRPKWRQLCKKADPAAVRD